MYRKKKTKISNFVIFKLIHKENKSQIKHIYHGYVFFQLSIMDLTLSLRPFQLWFIKITYAKLMRKSKTFYSWKFCKFFLRIYIFSRKYFSSLLFLFFVFESMGLFYFYAFSLQSFFWQIFSMMPFHLKEGNLSCFVKERKVKKQNRGNM